MDALISHHSSILCNSYSMGLVGKTRIRTKLYQSYVILFLTSTGGKNDSNAGRYTAYSQRGSAKTQSFSQYRKKTYRAGRTTSHQNWRSYKSQTECDRSVPQQEHHNRRQIKKAGSYQQQNNSSATQVLSVCFQLAESTLSSLRRSILILLDFTLKSQDKQSSKGGGWRWIP